MRLGALTSSLPADKRKLVDEMISDGFSLKQAIKYAEKFAESPDASQAQATRVVPPGAAATSASRSSQDVLPRTRGEWIQLNIDAGKGDAVAKRKLETAIMDDNFDVYKLPIA